METEKFSGPEGRDNFAILKALRCGKMIKDCELRPFPTITRMQANQPSSSNSA